MLEARRKDSEGGRSKLPERMEKEKNADCQHAGAVLPLTACIPSRKLPEQPGLGHPPVACHRFLGYFQNLCRFFDTEPAKKPEFHHTALTRIDLFKRRERFIQSLYVEARSPI